MIKSVSVRLTQTCNEKKVLLVDSKFSDANIKIYENNKLLNQDQLIC